MKVAVRVDPASRRFAVPYHPGLHKLVEEAVVRGDYLILPHSVDTTRLARNMGFKVPAPILKHYDWCNTTPFKTQRLAAATLTMNQRAYNLSEMGTGKTRAALYAIDYLMKTGAAQRALIVAPMSTLSMTWDAECLRVIPERTTAVLHGTRKTRLNRLLSGAEIMIINHDGVKTITEELCETDFDIVIIDESAAFKNARTDRWKAMRAILKNRDYVWGLTGSPTPESPTDAYGQIMLINPAPLRGMSFKSFRGKTMIKVSTFTWAPKRDAVDTVYSYMQPGVRFTRDQTVELPPVSYRYDDAPFSLRQERVYEKLRKKMTVDLAGKELTAQNEGVLYNKLIQISAGWVYTNTGDIIDLSPKGRLAALKDIIDEAPSKVLVFADFRHVVRNVFKFLKSSNYDVEMVTGETPKQARDEIFSKFVNTPECRVIVANPRCMSHGLTLVQASTVVWYTPTTSLETYEQACARITRAGQTMKQVYAHLVGSPIENKIYRRLRQKATLQGQLLKLFEG